MQRKTTTQPHTIADLLKLIQAQRSEDPHALARIQESAHAWLTRLESAKHAGSARHAQ
jgi:hypothetical protein